MVADRTSESDNNGPANEQASAPEAPDFHSALGLLQQGALSYAEIETLAAQAAHAQNWTYAAEFTLRLVQLQPSARKHRELSGYLSQVAGAAAGVENAIAASELDPECAEYAIHAGGLLNAASRYEEAVKFWQRALQREPHSALLHRHLSWTMEQCGKLTEAAMLALRAYELDPANIEATLAMSHVLGRLGRIGDAIKVLQLVISSGVRSASMHRTLSGYLASPVTSLRH